MRYKLNMIELKGKHNTAKVFTDNIDKETISQVIELLNQSFTANSKIRIMPDCHAGKGCVVGTTMTLTDKVVPNLVGVDIGCLDKDSEILTPHGWIKISEYNGEKVIIPMNMKDGSLICIGKGNPDWNYSAPHGAGRIMSRSQAKNLVNFNEFKESMNGIYSTSVTESTIDEAPMVYKPMTEIIENIRDTVDVIDVIKPIYNFKAH